MTEETLSELWKERDAWILKAQAIGEAEIRIRNERSNLLAAMDEIADELRKREDEMFKARHECYRKSERISRVIEMYDTRLQW